MQFARVWGVPTWSGNCRNLSMPSANNAPSVTVADTTRAARSWIKFWSLQKAGR